MLSLLQHRSRNQCGIFTYARAMPSHGTKSTIGLMEREGARSSATVAHERSWHLGRCSTASLYRKVSCAEANKLMDMISRLRITQSSSIVTSERGDADFNDGRKLVCANLTKQQRPSIHPVSGENPIISDTSRMNEAKSAYHSHVRLHQHVKTNWGLWLMVCCFQWMMNLGDSQRFV